MPVHIQSIQAGLAAVMVGLALLGSHPVWAADPPANAEVTLSTARRSELITLVRQDCGSCHGLTLKGGLGPPLLPAALAEKDRISLQYTILDGRRGTAMPPWRPFMREDEALWIVDSLKKGLPDERAR